MPIFDLFRRDELTADALKTALAPQPAPETPTIGATEPLEPTFDDFVRSVHSNIDERISGLSQFGTLGGVAAQALNPVQGQAAREELFNIVSGMGKGLLADATQRLVRIAREGPLQVMAEDIRKDPARPLFELAEMMPFGPKGRPGFPRTREAIVTSPRMVDKPGSPRPATGTPERFHELAMMQRGKPEAAMNEIQKVRDTGYYGYLAEHVGDLTHRMAQHPNAFHGGYEWVSEKVRNTLRDLRKPSLEIPESKKAVLRKLGQKYADEHRKLPVYNAAQKHARDAAIALGEFRFSDARKNLEVLEDWINKGETFWSNKALANMSGREQRPLYLRTKGPKGGNPPPRSTWGDSFMEEILTQLKILNAGKKQ